MKKGIKLNYFILLFFISPLILTPSSYGMMCDAEGGTTSGGRNERMKILETTNLLNIALNGGTYKGDSFEALNELEHRTQPKLLCDQLKPGEASEALFALSQYYKKKDNQRLSLSYLETAASNGYAKAQCNLGNYYYNDQQFTLAFSWYQRSAEKNITHAAYALGVCYEKGRGTTKSETESKNWYKKASEMGHTGAKMGFIRLTSSLFNKIPSAYINIVISFK